jgi:DnaK suppressor protein
MQEIDELTLNKYQQKLLTSLGKLRLDITKILLRSNHSSHLLIAKQVEKMSNDELIELTDKLNLPSIEHKIIEISEIDAALNNIQIGLYGICSDCEKLISAEQLNAQPTTQRCIHCDIKYKKQKYNHFKL